MTKLINTHRKQKTTLIKIDFLAWVIKKVSNNK